MRFLNIFAVFSLLLTSWVSVAETAKPTLTVGQTLSLPELNDQFDKKQTLLPSTKWLVFSHDMDSSKLVKAAFENKKSDDLLAANIQYYADISAMPSLISRFIAIPKMKKLAYSVIMDKEGNVLNAIPKKDDHVTVLTLNNGNITQINIVDTSKALKALIKSF